VTMTPFPGRLLYTAEGEVAFICRLSYDTFER